MSGRSAYVRKKITQTNKAEGKVAARTTPQPATDGLDDNGSLGEYPIPGNRPDLVGYGTTNGRFLKFSEPMREPDGPSYRGDVNSYGVGSVGRMTSGGSQSGSSSDGRRESSSHFSGPLDDFAYGRARKPTIKTEEVSAIEKSGLRNILDKKSDEVRKGLAKTFTFRKNRDKRDERFADDLSNRPQSAATVRPPVRQRISPADRETGYDSTLDLPASQYANGNGGSSNGNSISNGSSGHAGGLGPEPQTWDGPAAVAVGGGGVGPVARLTSPPPTANLPPVPATAPPIKRWIGAGRPVQRWNKLRKDPELWDPDGDVLVFYGHRGQTPRPNPSFRLSSHVIEATESRFLITLLRDGSTDEDFSIPPPPAGALAHGRYARATPPAIDDAAHATSLAEADGQISYEMYFPTPANLNRVDQLRHHITTRNVFALLYHASLVGLSLYQALSDLLGRLETYLPADADPVATMTNYLSARGIDDVRNDAETAASLLAWAEDPEVRWEEGWRESFLHCAGMHARLESTADFKHITPITRALLERASLEAQLRVQAAEERLAEFQYSDMWPSSVATAASSSGPVAASPAKAAAERLQKFLSAHYTRVYGRWPPLPASMAAAPGAAGAAGAGGAQQQHHHHHALRDVPIGTAYGGEGGEDEPWLTRAVAQDLQRDFAALYDYLVDRDVRWDGSETRSGRKWMLISESGDGGFAADTPDLPMTDMLIEFDNKLRFPHIPHPYPLVPESIPPPVAVSAAPPLASPSAKDGSSSNERGLFGGKSALKKVNSASAAPVAAGANSRGGTAAAGPARSTAQERRIQLAYTEATNLCILGSDFTHSDLVDAFGKFEKSDRTAEVDPSLARRARWVLVYGVLQTLASVSVDAPNVRYRDGVPYHLSLRLKGAKFPPWRPAGAASSWQAPGGGAGHPDEACHELSHCWTVVRTWTAEAAGGAGTTTSGAESSAASSGGSGNTSPVTRAYPFFPRLPAGLPSSAGGSHHSGGVGSSVAGSSVYGGASVGTASTAPTSRYASGVPFSSAGSVMSESEASVARAVRSSRKAKSNKDGPKTAAGPPTSGSSRKPRAAGLSQWPVPPSARSSSNITTLSGANSPGFLVLDDLTDDGRSFTTTVSRPDPVNLGAGRSGPPSVQITSTYGRPLLSGASSETESVAPVIRDFDELDVIDDHEP